MRLSGTVIYEERITFWIVVGIFLFLSALFLFMLLYQIFVAPIGTKPAPNSFLIIMLLVFMFFFFGFYQYRLILTGDMLVAGFPVYSFKMPWENIETVEPMKESMWKYGGYGIRVGKMNGKNVLLIVIPGAKHLKLTLRSGKWGYMVVSTKNVDTAINYIRQEIEIH